MKLNHNESYENLRTVQKFKITLNKYFARYKQFCPMKELLNNLFSV